MAQFYSLDEFGDAEDDALAQPLALCFEAALVAPNDVLVDFGATWDPAIFRSIRDFAVGDLARQRKLAAAVGFNMRARASDGGRHTARRRVRASRLRALGVARGARDVRLLHLRVRDRVCGLLLTRHRWVFRSRRRR